MMKRFSTVNFNKSIQQLFGIDLPIIQAPMAGVQGSALAAAVSNAGGLGSLPCATLSLDVMRREIMAIKSQTDKPFNVNFFCHKTPLPDEANEAAWRDLLAPYYEEYGILDWSGSFADKGKLQDRRPFHVDIVNVLEEFKPAVISFHFGLPSDSAALFERLKDWGSKIISSATTVEEAIWLENRGVDAIIAQGLEAGGHRGMFLSDDITTQIGTFALIPQIVQHVKVPVIAAGGIADAKGVAAAMALGAAGVQVGTAFLLCSEADTNIMHRVALKSDSARHTALTNVFSGRPARGIVNRIMREIGPINESAPAFPMASAGIAPLREKAESQNCNDFSSLWAGQNVSGCKEVPAAALVHSLFPERFKR